MSFDFSARKLNIITALKDYNTTTATPDLSSGLQVRIDPADILGVVSSKVRPAWRGDRFPSIFVKWNSADEDFLTLGGMSGVAGAKKEMVVTWDIVAFVGDSMHRSTEYLDTEMELMARNIQAVFYKENTGSGTALWIQPKHYQPNYEEINGAYVAAVLVQLEGKYLFT